MVKLTRLCGPDTGILSPLLVLIDNITEIKNFKFYQNHTAMICLHEIEILFLQYLFALYLLFNSK